MAFEDDGGGYGYKNPLSTNAYSFKGDWYREGPKVSDYWKGGFKVDNNGLWNKSFGRYNDPDESYLNLTKNKLFDTARRNKDDQDYGSSGSSRGSGGGMSGGGISSHSGEILPGLGVYESGKFSPIVLQAQQNKGLFGDIGGLAGGLGTAFGIFGPLGAPIGAAVGGIADRFV